MIDADLKVLCSSCGETMRIADCFVLDMDDQAAIQASLPSDEINDGEPTPGLAAVAAAATAEGEDTDGGPSTRRRVVGSGQLRAGQFVRSRIDGVRREIAALAGSGKRIPSAVELAARAGVSGHDVAWGCVMCGHPLPETIERYPTYGAVMAGPRMSAKTATVIGIMEHFDEAGGRFVARDRSDQLRPSQLTSTQQAHAYLETTYPGIFRKYRDRVPLDRTQITRHPPLPFDARVGGVEFGVSLLDLAGEAYAVRQERTSRAQSLRWAPAVLYFVDPATRYRGPEPDHASYYEDPPADAAEAGPLLNALISFIRAARSPLATPPHLFVIVSKADLIGGELTEEVVNRRLYNDEWVQQVLTNCGAATVTSAARSWPGGEQNVHWMFLAAMPPKGKAWGIRPLVNQMLSSFPVAT